MYCSTTVSLKTIPSRENEEVGIVAECATIPRGAYRSAEAALHSPAGNHPALGVEQLTDHVWSGAGHDEACGDPGRATGYVAPVAVKIKLHLVAHGSPGSRGYCATRGSHSGSE